MCIRDRCYSVYQYFLMLETKTAELDEQSALLTQQQATLDEQREELTAQQAALTDKQNELTAALTQLDEKESLLNDQSPVSYTHLDVYKRQRLRFEAPPPCPGFGRRWDRQKRKETGR